MIKFYALIDHRVAVISDTPEHDMLRSIPKTSSFIDVIRSNRKCKTIFRGKWRDKPSVHDTGIFRPISRGRLLTPSESSRNSGLICTALVSVLIAGVWISVPLYDILCGAKGDNAVSMKSKRDYRLRLYPDSGIQGIEESGHGELKKEPQGKAKLVPKEKRLIRVEFSAVVESGLPWTFQPEQTHLYVEPGETALAFFKVKNTSDKPMMGIAVYSTAPLEAGLYFNKIQCFCFDEQLLGPREELDMPVLFYIDPEIDLDYRLETINSIHLAYIFKESAFDDEIDDDMRDVHSQLASTVGPYPTKPLNSISH